MTAISEPFPLIGTRDYVHSTTLLTFLDRFQPTGLPPQPIDLRLRQKLRPGGQVFIDEGPRADAAATARVGERSFCFVNTENPVSALHQPDSFADFLPDITHAAGRTEMRPLLARNGPDSDAEVWPRLIHAVKRHLMCHHLPPDPGPRTPNFLLMRITCRKPHPQEALVITTDVVVGDSWFRLCVAGGSVLGQVFAASESHRDDEQARTRGAIP